MQVPQFTSGDVEAPANSPMMQESVVGPPSAARAVVRASCRAGAALAGIVPTGYGTAVVAAPATIIAFVRTFMRSLSDSHLRCCHAHYQPVLAFCARRTDLATADDVTSDVMSVAWRRLD